MSIIVWFRQDLRLADNPALFEAAKQGEVLPVFIREPREPAESSFQMGAASDWWLHQSLAALKSELPTLSLMTGDPRHLILQLARQSGARAVYWNRCYEPNAIARDSDIKAELQGEEIEARSFNAALLHEPWEIATKSGGPFKVYTPFWKATQQRALPQPLPRPQTLNSRELAGSVSLPELALLPQRPNWAAGWEKIWRPGEQGARERLDAFINEGLLGYAEFRDRPDKDNVSRLSASLHFGEISPRQIWFAIEHASAANPALERSGRKFLSEVAWRDFAYHLLYHFPHLPSENWRPAFDAYPWRECKEDLVRWQRGQTGYPLVDAGMRELWATGFMHNRVRMITASFLVKHLRLHWRHGEAWFRDTLVDADLANNSASWQWVAGSGADAAPYFRIFNPIAQAEKFDPDGLYIRKWVPELAKLENRFLAAPFDAPESVLNKAGIRLGETYPSPIVDHQQARKAALQGYEAVRDAGQNAA